MSLEGKGLQAQTESDVICTKLDRLEDILLDISGKAGRISRYCPSAPAQVQSGSEKVDDLATILISRTERLIGIAEDTRNTLNQFI